MGKQNTPLILGFVNNAGNNAWMNGTQMKQLPNQKKNVNNNKKNNNNKNQNQNQKNLKQSNLNDWVIVKNNNNMSKSNNNNNNNTQSFKSWADVVSKNSSKIQPQQQNLKNQTQNKKQNQNQKNVKQNKNLVFFGPLTKEQMQQQQRQQKQQKQQKQQMNTKQNKNLVFFGPLTKEQMQQQQRQQKQQKQQNNQNKKQQSQQKQLVNKAQQTEKQTWAWYPARHENQQQLQNNQRQKQQKQQQQKQQKQQPQRKQKQQLQQKNQYNMNFKNNFKNSNNYAARQQQIQNENWKVISQLYDAANFVFPSQNNRNAWLTNNKVGSDKVLSVATIYAIKNAPITRGRNKTYIRKNGQIIFNKNLRRAVEGKYSGHKKFRTNRILTNIPQKWFCESNNEGYIKEMSKIQTKYNNNAVYSSLSHNYSKYNIPNKNGNCFSFKGLL